MYGVTMKIIGILLHIILIIGGLFCGYSRISFLLYITKEKEWDNGVW